MIDEKLTALEIVGVAIRAEQDAHDLYESLSRRVANEELIKEFQELAGQEREHESWLTDYYREMTGESEAPPVPETRIKMFGPDVGDDMSVIEVLELAITKEHLAEEVYAEASRRSKDSSGRRLLQKLVEFERSHARRLQHQLAEARRNPAWLEDSGGRTVQLEGP